MFFVFKLNFVVDISAFFGNFFGYSLKNLAIFFLIVLSLCTQYKDLHHNDPQRNNKKRDYQRKRPSASRIKFYHVDTRCQRYKTFFIITDDASV
jgi:hypothetical protein